MMHRCSADDCEKKYASSAALERHRAAAHVPRWPSVHFMGILFALLFWWRESLCGAECSPLTGWDACLKSASVLLLALARKTKRENSRRSTTSLMTPFNAILACYAVGDALLVLDGPGPIAMIGKWCTRAQFRSHRHQHFWADTFSGWSGINATSRTVSTTWMMPDAADPRNGLLRTSIG